MKISEVNDEVDSKYSKQTSDEEQSDAGEPGDILVQSTIRIQIRRLMTQLTSLLNKKIMMWQ